MLHGGRGCCWLVWSVGLVLISRYFVALVVPCLFSSVPQAIMAKVSCICALVGCMVGVAQRG